MKRFLILIFIIFLPSLSNGLIAKDHNWVTAHFIVNGVCDQCKKRIESAAYIKGVKFAGWDVDTHDLTLKYDSSRVSPDDVLRHIALAGHDAGSFKATDEDYKKIPKCCRYRDGAKMPGK
jgi:hypothetical protein